MIKTQGKLKTPEDVSRGAKHKVRHERYLFRALILFILFFATGSGTANADILNLPRLDVTGGGNVTIGPQYSFVPQITSDTKLETFGSTLWRNVTWSASDKRVFRGIEVTNPTNRDSLKDKIGARYTNVGYYNGQKLDLKITVTNWSRYGNSGKIGTAARIGNISFERDDIAISTQGFNWVDTTWEYVRAGTNTRVPVSGYFTFSDIDMRQGVQFSKTTSQNIDRFLIENRNNKLKYQNVSGQYKIHDTTNIDVKDTVYDHQHAFTFLYSNLSSFSLRWTTDWANSPRLGSAVTKNRYLYSNTTNHTAGEYLFFVINKPARTSIPKPTKKVNITDNLQTSQKVEYTVEHTIPQEDSKFYHTSYQITDTLDTVLTNPTVKVETSSGQNITSRFTTSISGNKVTITAPAAELKRSRFYGDTIRYIISGTVDSKRLDTAMGSNSSYVIKNTATARVNGVSQTTNEVSSRIYKRALSVRHIDKDSGKVITTSSQSMMDGDTYSVTPRADLKSGADTYKPTSTKAQTGTINGKNATVDFYYTLPRDITVNHIDDTSKKVIRTETFRMHDGEKYSYSPRTDLKSGVDTYRPVSTNAQSGTMDGKNVTVNFYYTLPRVITVNHIDDTSKKVIRSDSYKLYDGEKYNYSPRTDLKSGVDTYRPVSMNSQSGTIAGKDVTVNFYYTLPRIITVNHIDDITRELISRQTYKLYDGERYTYSPRTDLKRSDGFSYKPRSMATQSGTVNKQPITIDFFYHVPKMTFDIDRIEIYTKQRDSNSSNGLPTHINLSSSLSQGSTANDFVGGKVRLVITDKDNNRDVYNKVTDIADLRLEIETALRTDYLVKNKKVNYDFKFSVTDVGSNNYELVTKTAKVTTHGYTASEAELTNAKPNYTGVIRTVKAGSSPVTEDKETLTLDIPNIEPQKTGYGFEVKFGTVYTNDLKGTTNIQTDFSIDKKMIDSNLQYDVSGGLAKIPMDRTRNTASNASKTTTSTFELPSLFIEQRTGHLYSSSTDSRIKNSVVDGGRKLYAPIWAELGDYSYLFESKSAIGVNKVTFETNGNLELFAHMFNHMDSDTTTLDEILIHQKQGE